MHPVQPHYPQPAAGTFTTQELQRLAAYRAAVVAGFYNEGWDTAGGPSAGERPVGADGPGAAAPDSAATTEQLAR